MTPRCCWTPGCGSRCATVSPRCCWATARCRRSTPIPRTPPICSAGWRRCRANMCTALWNPARRGRRPRNTSRRSMRCRSGRMLARCLVIRTCAPPCSDWSAPPTPTPSQPRPNWRRWRRCWTRRSMPGCWACPGWTRPSTSSTASAFARARCRPPSRRGRRGRMLQSAPDVENPPSALMFFLTSSRIFGRGKGVRMSMLVSADAKSMPLAVHTFGFGTRVLNAVLRSSVRFQHLPVPFELYSDGVDLPVFEEFGAGTAALHLRDQLERNKLLADKAYRREFRLQFEKIKLGPTLWHRDFHDAVIVECPDKSLVGKSFGQIANERELHPLDAFLDVLVENGERNVRWTTTVANDRPKQLNKLAVEPSIHMGFSDAGAHLRNMAFYNFSLRLLKRVLDAQRAGAPF